MSEDDLLDAIEESYDSWRSVQDIDQMSLRDIYECGFRHGVKCEAEAEKGD